MCELIIQTGFVNHFHWFRRKICSLINYSYALAVLKDMYLDFCIWQSLMAVIFSFRFWEPSQWEPLVRSAKISLGLQRKSAPWAQCHRQFHWEGPSGHYGLISHGWPSALFLWVKEALWSAHLSVTLVPHVKWRGALPSLTPNEPWCYVCGLQLWEYLSSFLSSLIPIRCQQWQLHQSISEWLSGPASHASSCANEVF